MEEKRSKVFLLLTVGLFATSFPAILVRLADADAVAIAFYRNFLASIFVLPIVLFNLRKAKGILKLLPQMFLTSFFLSFHFITWNASLKLTTVSSSLVIVATQPIWSAILGMIFLKEKLSLRGFVSILIALCGIAGIGFLDAGKGSGHLLGDILALLAAILVSCYLITGRSVKDRIPLSIWLFSIYFTSSMMILIVGLISGTEMRGFSQKTYLMFFLMALIPSFVGHSLLNYCVRHLEAYKVQLGILLEPIVSSILAYFIFIEKPETLFYPFATISIIGVIYGITEQSKGKNAVKKGKIDT